MSTVPPGGDRARTPGEGDGRAAAGGSEPRRESGRPDGSDPAAAGVGDAARRARAARAVRGTLTAALCLEALTVLFVPRAIAPVSAGGLTGARLAVLLGLAAALLVAAGLQRFRAGVVLGSVLQVAVLATGVLSSAMYVLGVLFGAVWIYLLRVRRELTGAGPASTP